VETSLHQSLGNVLVFSLFAVAFVVVNVALVARFLRPKKKEAAKETTYECGEPPIGSSWVRFDMRFYTVALVFLIFDVEVALLYPWARVMKRLALAGPFIWLEMLFFVGVLGIGLIHVWRKGDLNWVKSAALDSAGDPTTQGVRKP
jgi:NADH-quinone oxidoreductase subunit A